MDQTSEAGALTVQEADVGRMTLERGTRTVARPAWGGQETDVLVVILLVLCAT